MLKVRELITVLFFTALLGIPILTTSLSGGEVSESENRILAELPGFDRLGNRIIDRSFMTDTENWLNDHIGQRSLFRKCYALLMNHVFRIPTSDTVVFGRSGYYFYTRNHNLEIAKGTYPLSTTDINLIKENQQRISAYYKSKNVHYYLILTPSKVSVYPEYLPFEAAGDTVQPAEMIEMALSGMCDVINVKQALIGEKKDGPVFFRTDSHWNQRGSYAAYCEILRSVFPSAAPVSASWDSYTRTGDLFQALGLNTRWDKETVPRFSGTMHGSALKPDEMDAAFLKILRDAFEKQNTSFVDPAVYINDDIKTGTILVYGDSMTADYLKLPQYLGEHFHTVVQLRLRQITPEVEDYLMPDIVLYSTTERLIRDSLLGIANQLN